MSNLHKKGRAEFVNLSFFLHKTTVELDMRLCEREWPSKKAVITEGGRCAQEVGNPCLQRFPNLHTSPFTPSTLLPSPGSSPTYTSSFPHSPFPNRRPQTHKPLLLLPHLTSDSSLQSSSFILVLQTSLIPSYTLPRPAQPSTVTPLPLLPPSLLTSR